MAKAKNVSVAVIGQSVTAAQRVLSAQAFEPLLDDHPAYGLVGLITSECARVGHFLDATIFEFAGLQSHAMMGACITGQMIDMHPRYQALHQLSLEADIPKAIRVEIGRLEELSHGVAKRRNRAVHDAWMEEASWTTS